MSCRLNRTTGAVFLFVFFFLFSGGLFAEKERVTISGLTVGFNGCYKNGVLTPAVVGLTSDETAEVTVQLESEDPDGTPTLWEKNVTLVASESIAVHFLFMTGRENAPITIRVQFPSGEETVKIFKPDGEPPALKEEARLGESVLFPKPISAERPIWLTVGNGGNAVARMLASLQLPADRVPVLAEVSRFADLPKESRGFDGADLVILNSADTEAFADAEPEISIFREWILRGGKAYVFGSPDALPLLCPDGNLAEFIPGTVRRDHPGEIRTAPSLVRFVPKAKNLVMLGSLDSPFLRFAVLDADSDALVELAEEGVPLLVRGPAGFGTLTFFAADPQTAPLAEWNGRNGLLMRIFESEIERLTAEAGSSGLIRLGYGDLSGQMRSALDHFDGVRVVPFSAVLALMIFFVLAVGPLDWFLTNRLLHRPNLTWITLPLILFFFAVGGIWLGGWFRTGKYCVNSAELIDLDDSTGLVRGSVWKGIYAPNDSVVRTTFTPEFPGIASPDLSFSWHGLSGTGLGGMSSPIRSFAARSGRNVVENSTLCEFPVPVRSTRSFFGQWYAEHSAVSANLIDTDGVLTGAVVNPLPISITDAVLLYGNRAWVLGELQPGETEVTAKTPKTDELQRLLMGTTNPFDGRMGNFGSDAVWPRYSDASSDPFPVLRMMSFYRLAGGRHNAGVGSEGCFRLDASDSIGAGRAVLWGRLQNRGESVAGFSGIQFETGTAAGTIRSAETVAVRIWIPVKRGLEGAR